MYRIFLYKLIMYVLISKRETNFNANFAHDIFTYIIRLRETIVQCWLNPSLYLSDQCKEIIHNPIIGLFTCYIIMHHSYIIYRIPYDLILLLTVLFLFYSNVLQLNDSMQTFNCLLCSGAWTQKFVFFFSISLHEHNA